MLFFYAMWRFLSNFSTVVEVRKVDIGFSAFTVRNIFDQADMATDIHILDKVVS